VRVTDQLAKFIATGAFFGYSKVAPGTIGSATAVLSWWAVFSLLLPPTPTNQLIIFVAITVIGTIATSIVLRNLPAGNHDHQDPQYIVIDEWAGISLSLIYVSSTDFISIILAFVFFRLFDIFKPGPITWAEKLPGAYGVMADDLMAGLFAAISLQLLLMLYLYS
jgi:phosphatidylglycerophosphatase A